MNEIIHIGNSDISVKEYNGQRVVTFKDIDMVHNRVDGTAGRNFRTNKEHFIENEDFYRVSQPDEIRRLGFERPQGGTPSEVILLTEQGYLMLVKSFTDDLAWQVQRQLVNSYFRSKAEAKQTPKTKLEESAFLLKFVADDMRVNDASRLLMYENLCKDFNIPIGFLPKYEHNGSKEMKAATHLLKENGCSMTANAFNKKLMELGFLEEKERGSSSGKKKKYKSLTKVGLEFGENTISPHNQRETQPLYYADEFMKLYNLIE